MHVRGSQNQERDASGRERACRVPHLEPGENDWDPLDFRVLVKIEKHGRPVMGKFWFESGGRWFVSDRWFALPMRLIEGLGLSNYVLEEFERKPRWQVIIEE